MNLINNSVLLVIFVVMILQYFITYHYTNTKNFSLRALIRNFSIGLSIYFYYITKNIIFLTLPLIGEVLIEGLRLNGYHLERYIATEYQYSDYWREICKRNPIFTNFSESNYDKILGFNTTDNSSENYKKILDWSVKSWKNAFQNKTSDIIDMNNQKHEPIKLKKITDDSKFKLICDICKINNNMRILEVGFGECDFLLYLREHYNINAIGVSISDEQVKLAKSKSFEAYTMNSWNMTKEKIGTFDLILQCGNLEYIKCAGDSNDVYEKYSKIIYSLLNPNGKFFITCIHCNNEFNNQQFRDWYNLYILWAGNDGYYPQGRDGYTKYAEKAGFKIIYQENRVIDYWVAFITFFSSFQFINKENTDNTLSLSGLSDALVKTIAGPYYLHTYLCYTPSSYFYWLPWGWQFIPQKVNGKYITPVTLEYILLQK